jgi:hypothetical protein
VEARYPRLTFSDLIFGGQALTVETQNSVTGLDQHASVDRRWNPATLFAFRVWCLFFTVCLLPRFLGFVNFGIWAPVSNAFGRWPMTHVAGLPEHSSQVAIGMTGADYLPDYVAALVIASLSIVAAGVWSVVDRRRSHPRLFAWVYTTVRFVLSGILLFFGFDKVLPGQFGSGVDVEKVAQPALQLTPMSLLWMFMSASRFYTVCAGVVEVAGGLLLLTRRTAALGALVGTGAMAHVLMLNFGYDVSMKFVAAATVMMGAFLLAPHARRLARIFVFGGATAPDAPPALFSNIRRERMARIGGVVFALVVVSWAYAKAQDVAEDNIATASEPFYGVWVVEEMTRGGVAVPLLVTDDTLWRRLIFMGHGAALAQSMSDAVTRYAVNIDAASRAITFKPVGRQNAESRSYRFELVTDSDLELRTLDTHPTTVRLSRLDLATSPLVKHAHAWVW